jgi:AcrR family transcriptional regulator
LLHFGSSRVEGFAQRGYDGSAVAELAAATGMSKAAVSYHFPTKNDLLHALADPLLLDDLDALIERQPQVPTWPAGVRALLDDYLTTLSGHRQVAAWLDSDKAVPNHPEIGARLHRNIDRRRQAVTGSTTDGAVAGVRAMAALGSLWRPDRSTTLRPPRRPHPRHGGRLPAGRHPVRHTAHPDLTAAADLRMLCAAGRRSYRLRGGSR